METPTHHRPVGTPRDVLVIEGNTQRLDGGAMFGNAPRAVWSRWIAPDERHRIPLACRAMLVREDSGRLILCEAGIGAFFPPAMKDRFGVVEDNHVLLDSLAAHGVAPADIDVIVLSHLHFDHAGGLLSAYREGQAPRLVFPDARYVVSRPAWERALRPHARDKASFIPELTALLEASDLELVESHPGAGALGHGTSAVLGPSYRLHLSEGHTPGLMLTEVALPEGPIVYAGDLIPGAPWVHLPITMGYDRYPERLIDEKAELLSELVARGGRLFFTHDPTTPMGLVRFEAGRYSLA
jgi:glyoxylase-like metal-dependent hydrolase (beta-lactamase superfamily II)